jgi:hypothetical protein
MKNILILILITFSIQAKSQDWIYVGYGKNGSKYYIRNSSIKEYNNSRVWVKTIANKMQYVKNGKTYDLINGTSLDLYEFDCSLRQMKLLSYAYYNSKGTLVSSKSLNYYLSDSQDVLPDSIGEMLLNKVCELF